MTKQQLALASLALLAQTVPASQTTIAHSPEATRLTLNAASTGAIQNSWMKIPPMCKDRSFPFAAFKVGTERMATEVQQLFAELDSTVQKV